MVFRQDTGAPRPEMFRGAPNQEMCGTNPKPPRFTRKAVRRPRQRAAWALPMRKVRLCRQLKGLPLRYLDLLVTRLFYLRYAT